MKTKRAIVVIGLLVDLGLGGLLDILVPPMRFFLSQGARRMRVDSASARRVRDLQYDRSSEATPVKATDKKSFVDVEESSPINSGNKKTIATFKDSTGIEYSILRWVDDSGAIHFGAVHFDPILNGEISLVLPKEEDEPASILIGVIPINPESRLGAILFRYFNKEATKRGVNLVRTQPLKEISPHTPLTVKIFLEEMQKEKAIIKLKFEKDVEGKEFAVFEIPVVGLSTNSPTE